MRFGNLTTLRIQRLSLQPRGNKVLVVVFWTAQEKERRQRTRVAVNSASRLKTFPHQRNSDDDDDDDIPQGGGLNGGFGSFHNGPRVIF